MNLLIGGILPARILEYLKSASKIFARDFALCGIECRFLF